ncbi:ATP-binding protein [Streptomyces sp. R39]|uniref:ATP-binding protein n=1 Tax=Streptomyces sp. R39 TaxID=3238631 RepID=A0AB39QPM6_9ACTN
MAERFGVGCGFVGRGAERVLLRRLLRRLYEEAASGRPRVVVVEGAAGIGKTALVRRARPRCRRGRRSGCTRTPGATRCTAGPCSNACRRK